MAEGGSLYETDFVRWSETQAEALRAAAALRTNEPLDWENLAEEIESLGKSQRHELRSRTRTLVEHLLKLEYSAATEPRPGWSRTVRRTRIAIDDILAESPSLRPILPELLAPFGLDAKDPGFWQIGLSMIEGMIAELEAMEEA